MDFARILYSEISFEPETIGNSDIKGSNSTNEEFQAPKQQLCDPNLVQLDWLQSEKIGAGLINVGNTCFLNSVLQCLTYCPPLYNFLVKSNGGHSNHCKISSFCMLCEMEKHIKRIKNSSVTAIKPLSIVQRLKYINKSFQFGRQEDAHEFLRYIIDHMWKACLMNLDINTKVNKLDPRIKETTTINHIFGGYHRSQVLCLSCNSRSNTFDFFMDFILDIRNAKSLEDALKQFTRPETLENENAYKCCKCRKKVAAKKKFTVYKAPNVATFQLKRFDSDRIFGGKVTKFISYPEELDLRPFMADPTKTPIKYILSSVLVHVGFSSNSGHYFCFIRNSNNFWYRMDDSSVSLVTKGTVLQQQAYVLFYTRKSSDIKNPSNLNNISKVSEPAKQINGNHKITKYFDPISPPKKYLKPTQNGDSGDQIIPSNGIQEPSKSSQQTNHNGDLTTSSIPSIAPLTTWVGSKSNLDTNGPTKRSTEQNNRDRFNEELDQGKTKKLKNRSRDERFSNLSKTNLFQRFMSNGYKQYENDGNLNMKRNSSGISKHGTRQYSNDNIGVNGFSGRFRRHDYRHAGKYSKKRHYRAQK